MRVLFQSLTSADTFRRGAQKSLHLLKMATAPFRTIADFIIIGAQRAGTSSLYQYLLHHPSVMPAAAKEVHFFDNNFSKGEAWYRAHFATCWAKRRVRSRHKDSPVLTGEATPYYLYHPHVPRRVLSMLPQAKLIVLLRNPVDRAYSNYQMTKRRRFATVSFEEAIEKELGRMASENERMMGDENYRSLNHQRASYLGRGIYVDQLKRWLDLFPRRQMLILKSESFFKDADASVNQAFDFLGLSGMRMSNSIRMNEGGYQEGMGEVTRKRLTEYFRPHNRRLYEYLGVNFDWENS